MSSKKKVHMNKASASEPVSPLALLCISLGSLYCRDCVACQMPSYSRMYLMTASEKPSMWVQFP